jgi:hypothetical protein
VIAGIAGLGIIALAGGAFAFSRRNRRYQRYEDIDVVPAQTEMIAPAPIATPDSTIYAQAPHTGIPAGFDLSRFGRHTQAAYRGPTPDNSSLSLKRRLKHASFYDQRERMASAGAALPVDTLAASPAAAPRSREHADHIVSRMRPTTRFRPVTA